MLPARNEYLCISKDEEVAVCGLYCGKDAIHVGLFWNSEGEKKIIHFQNGKNIPVAYAAAHEFEDYYFNQIADFPKTLLPSLAALAELVSENKLNRFIFNRVGVVYNGGKFEYLSGSYQTKSAAEKFVNCGVFVIALLATFDYILLDWASWPDTKPANLTFLHHWLDVNGIPDPERPAYYRQTKELRGQHVLVCPGSSTQPCTYTEAELKANELIARFLVKK